MIFARQQRIFLVTLLLLNGFLQSSINKKSIEEKINNILDRRIKTVIYKQILSDAKKDSYSRQCFDAGVRCSPYCATCFPGGWCILTEEGVPTNTCLCQFGWTGDGAYYKQDSGDKAYGRNRIVAKNCNTPCHYTHDYRNEACAKDSKNICDPEVCEKNGRGKCVHGTCKCCRGWTSKEAKYSKGHYYVTDYETDGSCDIECPYLGKDIENPSCSPAPAPSPCHPLCEPHGGTCNEETGRCTCCEAWTGDEAVIEEDGRVSVAGYCDCYCQYTRETRNLLCVNPSYVKRCKRTTPAIPTTFTPTKKFKTTKSTTRTEPPPVITTTGAPTSTTKAPTTTTTEAPTTAKASTTIEAPTTTTAKAQTTTEAPTTTTAKAPTTTEAPTTTTAKAPTTTAKAPTTTEAQTTTTAKAPTTTTTEAPTTEAPIINIID